MIATTSRPAADAAPTRPHYADAAVDAIYPHAESDADSAYLRRWVARHAARYDDLLATIAVATRAARRAG